LRTSTNELTRVLCSTPDKQGDCTLLIADNRDKLHEPEELLREYRKLSRLVRVQASQIVYLREHAEGLEKTKTQQAWRAVETTDELIVSRQRLNNNALGLLGRRLSQGNTSAFRQILKCPKYSLISA
jgi:hypothetical protein